MPSNTHNSTDPYASWRRPGRAAHRVLPDNGLALPYWHCQGYRLPTYQPTGNTETSRKLPPRGWRMRLGRRPKELLGKSTVTCASNAIILIRDKLNTKILHINRITYHGTAAEHWWHVFDIILPQVGQTDCVRSRPCAVGRRHQCRQPNRERYA